MRQFFLPGKILAVAPAGNMLPGPCLILAFGYFWPQVLPIFFITTVLKTEFCRLYCQKMLLTPCLLDANPAKRYQLTVDLAKQQIVLPTGERLSFAIDMFRKECLLQGLDDIALTLEKADLIRAYEAQRRESMSVAVWRSFINCGTGLCMFQLSGISSFFQGL